MRLHVANVTKQRHIFAHYVPGNPKLQEPEIGAGRQIVIEGGRGELESIVEQHRRFGLVEFDVAAKTPAFAGICYRFDAAIPSGAMMDALDRRQTVEDERAQEVRTDTAAAIDQNAMQELRNVGAPIDVSTTVELEERRRPDAQVDAKPVKQQVKVDRAAPEARQSRRK